MSATGSASSTGTVTPTASVSPLVLDPASVFVRLNFGGFTSQSLTWDESSLLLRGSLACLAGVDLRSVQLVSYLDWYSVRRAQAQVLPVSLEPDFKDHSLDCASGVVSASGGSLTQRRLQGAASPSPASEVDSLLVTAQILVPIAPDLTQAHLTDYEGLRTAYVSQVSAVQNRLVASLGVLSAEVEVLAASPLAGQQPQPASASPSAAPATAAGGWNLLARFVTVALDPAAAALPAAPVPSVSAGGIPAVLVGRLVPVPPALAAAAAAGSTPLPGLSSSGSGLVGVVYPSPRATTSVSPSASVTRSASHTPSATSSLSVGASASTSATNTPPRSGTPTTSRTASASRTPSSSVTASRSASASRSPDLARAAAVAAYASSSTGLGAPLGASLGGAAVIVVVVAAAVMYRRNAREKNKALTAALSTRLGMRQPVPSVGGGGGGGGLPASRRNSANPLYPAFRAVPFQSSTDAQLPPAFAPGPAAAMAAPQGMLTRADSPSRAARVAAATGAGASASLATSPSRRAEMLLTRASGSPTSGFNVSSPALQLRQPHQLQVPVFLPHPTGAASARVIKPTIGAALRRQGSAVVVVPASAQGSRSAMLNSRAVGTSTAPLLPVMMGQALPGRQPVAAGVSNRVLSGHSPAGRYQPGSGTSSASSSVIGSVVPMPAGISLPRGGGFGGSASVLSGTSSGAGAFRGRQKLVPSSRPGSASRCQLSMYASGGLIRPAILLPPVAAAAPPPPAPGAKVVGVAVASGAAARQASHRHHYMPASASQSNPMLLFQASQPRPASPAASAASAFSSASRGPQSGRIYVVSPPAR